MLPRLPNCKVSRGLYNFERIPVKWHNCRKVLSAGRRKEIGEPVNIQTKPRQTAVFCCKVCSEEWTEELPPLWLGMETWPTCCGTLALLIHEVVKIV